jgi:tripartite-type tricarboxylate transporter receptor subunit TctC
MAFGNTPNAAPLIQEGKMRALAVAHPTRVPQLPDVPTAGEQGYPGFESNSGYMYFAPGGTPPEVLDRLNAVFVEVLNLPAVKDALTKQGVEVKATTRAQTAEFIKNEMKRYGDIVAFSGAKVD